LKTIPILFFEDSSKVKLGGGQELSLLAMQSFRGKFPVQLFDYARDSVFLARAGEILALPPRRLWGFGRVVRHQYQSFSCGWLELFFLPFFLSLNCLQVIGFLVRTTLFRRNPLLFCATNKTLVLAVLISCFMKCRIVFYAHNINDPNRLICRCFNFFLRRCDVVLGVSQAVCDSVPVKAELLYGAREMGGKSPDPREISSKDKIRVAVFASLQRWKGIDFFISSFAFLKHQEQVEYWICGEGPERVSLETLSEGNPRIIFQGFVDFSNMADQVDIVVLPSVEPEAFGLNIIKAAQHGIPVIATDLGAHGELVEDQVNGIKIPSQDAAAIAGKIDYLIEHPQVYSQLSNSAVQYAGKFNPDLFRRKLRDIIGSLN